MVTDYCLFRLPISRKYNSQYPYSVISFTFNQKVSVTESYIPEFSLSSFMAELGGSLGLWLGVGAVQLLSGGLTAASWIRSKYWDTMQKT